MKYILAVIMMLNTTPVQEQQQLDHQVHINPLFTIYDAAYDNDEEQPKDESTDIINSILNK